MKNIIDFLEIKGIPVNSNPNVKIIFSIDEIKELLMEYKNYNKKHK